MQKCKYLDDLGLKLNEYGTNFCDDTDPRMKYWLQQQEEYGFDERETWNMDYQFLQWIYTRMKMYCEECCVDTSFHKFIYKDKEMTQQECIDRIFELAEENFKDNKFPMSDQYYDNMTEICEIWAIIWSAMWW